MSLRVLIAILLVLSAPAWAQTAPPHRVQLEARMTAKAPPLAEGVRWRVYREALPGGELEQIKRIDGGAATIELPTGSYYLHAGFGQAGRTVRLDVDGDTLRSIVLGAGGLMLDATSGGKPIAPDLLRFDVYEHAEDAKGNRRIVAFNVEPDHVLPLNAGTYHVLSRYGRLGTEVRADLVVSSGQTTRAVMQHRGAEVRLKLASKPGGLPIASTAWTLFSDQGEKIHESALNAPRIVLPEGDYEVVARNGALTLKRAFEVRAGEMQKIELLLP